MTIEEIRDYLTAAIAEHGLPAVLQATARVMADISRVSSGVVSEVAAIEAPWRDLPERFGDGVKVHLRFSRWAKSGVWERVFQYLAADADNEYAMIDSTIVRAHQHSAGAQKKLARIKQSDARAAD